MNPERIAQLHTLIALDPEDPFLPYAIAQEYLSGEQWQEASRQLERVRADFPDYLPTYYHLGLAYAKMAELHRAAEILSLGTALAKAQKDAKTLLEIASLLEDLQ
ncbi:MAG: hypothetical protein RLZZ165_1017 [Bacteroidota bacterium]|jgi:predicted Zn-dependent protease